MPKLGRGMWSMCCIKRGAGEGEAVMYQNESLCYNV